jgi:hypothetical protein
LAIATVRVRPSRLSGSTMCRLAMSAGISLTILASTSKRERSTAGTRSCRATMRVISTFRHQVLLGEDETERHVRRPVLGQRLGQLLAREQTLLYQDVAEPIRGECRSRHAESIPIEP